MGKIFRLVRKFLPNLPNHRKARTKLAHATYSKTISLFLVLGLGLGQLGAAPRERGRQAQQLSRQQPAGETKAAQPLSEEETSEYTKRSEDPGKEVAGGALSNQTLTYIVIALAAAVIVLIAVH